MALIYYMDVHVPAAITEGLRRRGIDVLTSQEDGMRTVDDETLLQRATDLGRLLFSQDEDVLRIVNRWAVAGRQFAGVLFAAGIEYRAARRRFGTHFPLLYIRGDRQSSDLRAAALSGVQSLTSGMSPCDTRRKNSTFAHSFGMGGLSVCLADASCRNIAPSISVRAWNLSIQPNDGQVLGQDWNS